MATGGTGGYDRDALLEFLVGYGLALGAGDLEGLSSRFDLPALLVAQEETVLVTTPEDVLRLSRERPTASAARESVATVPEVTSIEEVGWGLLWVEVRWSYRDEYAAQVASERSRYLLRRGRGTFEVCVVVPVPD